MDTTYIVGAPNVHLHYMRTDEQAKEDAYGVVEFCCHVCHHAVVMAYDVPPKDLTPAGLSPKMQEFRDQFETAHRPHTGLGEAYKVLCPPARKGTDFLDLRPANG